MKGDFFMNIDAQFRQHRHGNLPFDPLLFRVLGGALLALGLLLLTLAAWLGWREYSKNSERLHARATVVELVQKHSGGTMYYPRLRFTAQNGQEYTVLSSSGSNPPSWAVGEELEVHYSPAHPEKASLCSFRYAAPAIVAAMGAGLALPGSILLALSRRKNLPKLNFEPGELKLPRGMHLGS